MRITQYGVARLSILVPHRDSLAQERYLWHGTMVLPRVIFVTGKGGTGKSTIAAALALAMSRRHHTIVADLDRRSTAARLLGLKSGEVPGPPSSRLQALSLTPRAELEAFIERIVSIKAISRRMLKSHTFAYVTAALPGLEAFLMLDRLRLLAEEAARRDGFVIIDAPATGSGLELLSVWIGVKELAPTGTLNRLAKTIEEFIKAPKRFGVILTVLPETLALSEAIDAGLRLRSHLGIECVAAIVNGVTHRLFSAAELAVIHGLGQHRKLAQRRAATADLARQAHEQLEAGGFNVIELPMLYSSCLGRDELETLADQLAHSGLLR
jgi:Mrp family chromosome partitioning ATPase